MRILLLAFFLFQISAVSFAQIGDIFIDERRGTVQARLGSLEIEEYEKEHVGYRQGDSLMLYVFFDEHDICTKYYWMATANEKEDILNQFASKNWQKRGENEWLRENCKTSIKPLNSGKNVVFLVEKNQHEPVLTENKKKEKQAPPKVQAKPKTKKKPKEEQITVSKKTSPPQKEKQALTFLGWEIANFDQ